MSAIRFEVLKVLKNFPDVKKGYYAVTIADIVYSIYLLYLQMLITVTKTTETLSTPNQNSQA